MEMIQAYEEARRLYPGCAVFWFNGDDMLGWAVFNREGPVAFFNQDPDTSQVQQWNSESDGHVWPGEPVIDWVEDELLEDR
jgi:hypothetical protein